MNKIFKVIWNKTTQRLEVVSELARSQGKAAATTDNRVSAGGGNLNPRQIILYINPAGIINVNAIQQGFC
ncbi:ESPR domain-containing protein [Haemophilus influenzae]|uniref:ESPR domain-containing protein n=1 Tax=Haemophilus influenzae TaxID=727 RepID=A0AB37B416_HAEIF|nr:ESPR domain-containing protein [Haemophilus influenzae]PRJ24263.1 hypothetical protein BV056_01200 [Haemophilus influenzae]PRM82000.1 hypothetical protein BV055_01536 [Haemophilus influenzae]